MDDYNNGKTKVRYGDPKRVLILSARGCIECEDERAEEAKRPPQPKKKKTRSRGYGY